MCEYLYSLAAGPVHYADLSMRGCIGCRFSMPGRDIALTTITTTVHTGVAFGFGIDKTL